MTKCWVPKLSSWLHGAPAGCWHNVHPQQMGKQPVAQPGNQQDYQPALTQPQLDQAVSSGTVLVNRVGAVRAAAVHSLKHLAPTLQCAGVTTCHGATVVLRQRHCAKGNICTQVDWPKTCGSKLFRCTHKPNPHCQCQGLVRTPHATHNGSICHVTTTALCNHHTLKPP